MSPPGDNPISSSEDDLLGRDRFAANFAEQVLALDAEEGLVVGILGVWGSGKTSMVNLARRHLEGQQIAIVDFNPWMFSGADQLVQAFFIELASQLKVKPGLAEIGEGLEEYGEAFGGLGWLPFVGTWIERLRGANKVVAELLQRRKQGVSGRRERIVSALRELDVPIVVVVDDIDRLTSREIRDVFKLIRLTASFPNMIYLVAFDRQRVEQALEEDGVPGRSYLEKILQVGVDLPEVPSGVLNSQVLRAINESLADLETSEFNEAVWIDIYYEVIRPLVGNMRDVRRYAAAINGTVRWLKGGVAVADLLAMEAVRVFLPDVHRLLSSSVEGLTKPYEFVAHQPSGDPHLQAQVEALIAAGEEHQDVVIAMIDRLFPAGSRHLAGGSNYGSDWQKRWLQDRRVAHPDVLRLYLDGQPGEELVAFGHAERMFEWLTDRSALEEYLQNVPLDLLADVVSSLEAYEDQYRADQVVPTSIVLLNLTPKLPEKRAGLLNPFGERILIKRVVLRLLRVLGGAPAVETAVEQILPSIETLSSQLDLILLVGHRENAGHELVSEESASRFEREWRARVRQSTTEKLVEEKELLAVLFKTIDEAEDGEPTLTIGAEPRMTLALLEAARTDVVSQSMGSRATHRLARLHWEILVEIYGDEATVKERIGELQQAELASDSTELVELAEKYLTGWRPEGR